MIKSCYRFVVLMILWASQVADLPAQTTAARVQYSQLYNALKPGLVINGFAKLRAVQRIHSRMPGVTPNQINVRILTKAGAVNVAVGPDGVTNFPMTDALLAENPAVESNQPKGSLSVTATMEFDLAGKTKLTYIELADCIKQAELAIAELGGGMAGRRVKSIEFEFQPGLEVRADVIAGQFEELFLADERGLIRLRIDERKVKAGARVEFSSAPLSVRPQID